MNLVSVQNISEAWDVALVSEKLVGVVPEITYRKTFKLDSIQVGNYSDSLLEMKFSTNMNINFPISMGYNLQPINTDDGIIYAGLVLIGLYLMIIFEVSN